MPAITGIGTEFDQYNTGTGEWDVVSLIKNIVWAANRDTLDTSTLDTEDYRTFITSFKDGGTVTLSLNFNRDEYDALKEDFDSNTPRTYKIILPDTVSTALRFTGLVSEMSSEIPEGIVTFDVTIKVTGIALVQDAAILATKASGGTSVGIRLSMGTGSFELDWGDNSSELITGPVTDVTYSHTYETSDSYVINFLGDATAVTKIEHITGSFAGTVNTLGGFTGLTYFEWAAVATAGNIDTLYGATGLTHIEFQGSAIDGTLDGISALTGLTYFDAGDTPITGNVSNVASLTGLTWLRLGSAVTGSISSFGSLSSLETLYIPGGSVNGDLSTLSGLSSIISLSLRTLSITGNVSSITGLSTITTLDLNGSGPVTGSTASLASLGKQSVNINVASTSVTYSGGPTWPDVSYSTLNFANLSWSQGDVDGMLADMVNASGPPVSGVLSLQNNSTPSGSGFSSKSTLEGRGWTVTTS
jgi:hypothetical protein